MYQIYDIQNQHWENRKYGFIKKRTIFKELSENLNNKLIISLEGPRRVGKSVLMKQLIDLLINNKVNSKDILYFSFDKYDKKILDLLKEYEVIRKKSLRTGKIYLFLDEIQRIKDWQVDLKIIYDNYPNIKIIISGSTLRVSKKESLAGRIFEYFIKPLSFKEYLIFSDNNSLLDSEYDEAFLNEYNIYLFRQYPDLAINRNLDTKKYISSIIQKIIYEDSEKYIKNVDKDLLHNILNIILRDPGQIIDYTDFASSFKVKRNIISQYIDFLVKSGIIKKIYNFSKNVRKLEIKSKKFYPFCTTLIKYVADNPDFSKVIETDCIFQLNANFFLNNKGKEEIDIILYNSKISKTIGVEVKYRNYIQTKDLKNFNSKIVSKLNLYNKFIIIKENSKLDFNTNEIVPIKYYVLWKYKKLVQFSECDIF